VNLVSANGIVPAGFSTLPSQNKEKIVPFSYTLPLERCDDPKAQIKLVLSVDQASKGLPLANTETLRIDRKNDKRVTSPISSLQNGRDFSRISSSATKIQSSRRSTAFSYFHSKDQLKFASP